MKFQDATHAVALVQQDEYSTQRLSTGEVKMKLEEQTVSSGSSRSVVSSG